MNLQKSFELALAPDIVWEGLCDLELVASCLPGASLGEKLADGYRGRMTVRLGPLSVGFDGEMAIERREAQKTAVVKAKGNDSRSGTRVQATMTYGVRPGSAPQSAVVDIDSEIALAGALAQFGKAAVMQEVAEHMTAQFARNFTARLSAASAAPAAPAAAAAQLNGFALAWKIIRARLKALFGVRSG